MLVTELLEWCAQDVRPLCIVNDKGLHYLLAFLEPSYKVPLRTHLTAVSSTEAQPCEESTEKGTCRCTLSDRDDQLVDYSSWATEGYRALAYHYIS